MPRPRLHDDALRDRLLEVASAAISRGGVDALRVRDVAASAGTSASAVYALFGGRDELVRAVGDEAFRRFAAHLGRAGRTDDPATDLLSLGLAYRTSALTDPHFYRVMFEAARVGAQEPSQGPATAHPTFVVLRDAVDRVLGLTGAPRREDDALEAAVQLWGLVHGLVGLELAGLVPGDAREREERFRGALLAVGTALLDGPRGDG
ncbi:TetR/AcrR family transcriptional regulator [Cellulomonas cellasea]|uniref:TetR family transcriptional regulator n=2 Tax=Cellulomonas cellasea TaxID=43670 RepID=A0A0A0B8Y3_9CELL|nr:TetR-like C-terminal domain-containing protein [Cellulomonas cellasea]KGM02658.1 TetR family transcriptional regulator [Cellulomonas cellasea DSM 20118]